MKQDELDRVVAERAIEVRGDQVTPYLDEIPCTVKGQPDPFLNTVVCRRVEDDGSISLMLDTHNFMHLRPDELVQVVPRTERYYSSQPLPERLEGK